MTTATANRVAQATSDAYSADRYGPKQWAMTAEFLLAEKFTEQQVEELLRSKIPRWAADQDENPEKPTAWGFSAFWQKMGQRDRIVAEIFADAGV